MDEAHVFGRAASDAEILGLAQGTEGGHYERYYYDALGRAVKAPRKDYLGSLVSESTYGYNWRDQLSRATDPVGRTSATEHDFLGRPIRYVNGDGTARVVHYYGGNNSALAVDEVGRRELAVYDWNRRLVRVGEWNPATGAYNMTLQEYEGAGLLRRLQDAGGLVAGHEYDDLRSLKTTWFWESLDGSVKTSESYTYDSAGNLLTVTRRDGSNVGYEYDDVDRLRKITYRTSTGALQATETFTQDKNDNPKRLATQDATGVETSLVYFEYDPRNRLLSEAYVVDGGTNRSVQYAYDASSNVVKMTYPSGLVFQYGYDSLNRNVEACEGTAPCVVRARFTFRPDDEIDTIEFGNGMLAKYTYHSKREWVANIYFNTSATANLMQLDYAYHPDGLVKQHVTTYRGMDPPDVYAQDYAYDGQGRLWSYSLSGTANGLPISDDRVLQLSASGDWSRTTKGGRTYDYAYEKDHRMKEIRRDGTLEDTFTYNKLGQMATMRIASWSRNYDFTYGPNGRLVRATKDPASSTPTHYYLDYDAHGRMIQLEVSYSSTMTYFYHSGIRIISRLHGTTFTDYLWANGLVLMKASGTDRTYLHQDILGSVRLITDSEEGVVFRVGYGPFGDPCCGTGSTASDFRFQGAWLESLGSVAFYYLNARWYDAIIGRFLSQDEVPGRLPSPQSLNRYAFTENNPVNFVDPTGYSTGIANRKQGIDHRQVIRILLLASLVGLVGNLLCLWLNGRDLFHCGGPPAPKDGNDHRDDPGTGTGDGGGRDDPPGNDLPLKDPLTGIEVPVVISQPLSAMSDITENRQAGLRFEDCVSEKTGEIPNRGEGQIQIGRYRPDFRSGNEAKRVRVQYLYRTKQIINALLGRSPGSPPWIIYVPEGGYTTPSRWILDRQAEGVLELTEVPCPP